MSALYQAAVVLREYPHQLSENASARQISLQLVIYILSVARMAQAPYSGRELSIDKREPTHVK